MAFQIEIKEGCSSSPNFLFTPVVMNKTKHITEDDLYGLDDGFFIEDDDIECFLCYFLFKYFDGDLIYNKERYPFGDRILPEGFEWYAYNFYTYETMNAMLDDIDDTALLLEDNYNDPRLDEVKKDFSIYNLCPKDNTDYIVGNDAAILKYKGIVIDFYRRFTARLRKMMADHPSGNLIAIIGP